MRVRPRLDPVQVPLAVAEQWHSVLLDAREAGQGRDLPLGQISNGGQQLDLSDQAAVKGGLAKHYRLDSLSVSGGDVSTVVVTWPEDGRPGTS
jgi:hypothetical protein